jgi:predicted ribosome-associated RNA-binding protein Tma20
MSTRDLQKMVQALPQYSEQIDKLSLHVEVSSCAMQSWYSEKSVIVVWCAKEMFYLHVEADLSHSCWSYGDFR